jgi:hypothetical protein
MPASSIGRDRCLAAAAWWISTPPLADGPAPRSLVHLHYRRRLVESESAERNRLRCVLRPGHVKRQRAADRKCAALGVAHSILIAAYEMV